jgi:hypothetical protein
LVRTFLNIFLNLFDKLLNSSLSVLNLPAKIINCELVTVDYKTTGSYKIEKFLLTSIKPFFTDNVICYTGECFQKCTVCKEVQETSWYITKKFNVFVLFEVFELWMFGTTSAPALSNIFVDSDKNNTLCNS